MAPAEAWAISAASCEAVMVMVMLAAASAPALVICFTISPRSSVPYPTMLMSPSFFVTEPVTSAIMAEMAATSVETFSSSLATDLVIKPVTAGKLSAVNPSTF